MIIKCSRLLSFCSSYLDAVNWYQQQSASVNKSMDCFVQGLHLLGVGTELIHRNNWLSVINSLKVIKRVTNKALILSIGTENKHLSPEAMIDRPLRERCLSFAIAMFPS